MGFRVLKSCDRVNSETLAPRLEHSRETIKKRKDDVFEPPRPLAAILRDAKQANSQQRFSAANSPADVIPISLYDCLPIAYRRRAGTPLPALSPLREDSLRLFQALEASQPQAVFNYCFGVASAFFFKGVKIHLKEFEGLLRVGPELAQFVGLY